MISLIQTPLTCAGRELGCVCSRQSGGQGAGSKKHHETDGRGAKPLNHAAIVESKPASHETRSLSSAVFLCLLNCMNKADTHTLWTIGSSVFSRNTLETGLLKHRLLYKACLKNATGILLKVKQKVNIFRPIDASLTFVTFRFINVSREAASTLLL